MQPSDRSSQDFSNVYAPNAWSPTQPTHITIIFQQDSYLMDFTSTEVQLSIETTFLWNTTATSILLSHANSCPKDNHNKHGPRYCFRIVTTALRSLHKPPRYCFRIEPPWLIGTIHASIQTDYRTTSIFDLMNESHHQEDASTRIIIRLSQETRLHLQLGYHVNHTTTRRLYTKNPDHC